MRGRSTRLDGALEGESLNLELLRLERAIASARSEGRGDVAPLVARREELRHRREPRSSGRWRIRNRRRREDGYAVDDREQAATTAGSNWVPAQRAALLERGSADIASR